MRVLITGINGFTGSHLADYLLTRGCTVYGTVHVKGRESNISNILDQVQMFECDVCDLARIKRVVQETRPNVMLHLAAKTSCLAAIENRQTIFDTNVFGTMNLLEAVRQVGTDPVILVAGSSGEFGLVERDENPVKETHPYRPVSLYAVSKIAQGMVAYQYYLTYGIKTIRTHTFNYIGPRQSEEFVCSAFARQIVEIEKGLKPPVIEVGNLDAWRDFTDVRDVVRAYWLAVGKGVPGNVYNICSGNAYSIKEILEKFLNQTTVKIEVRQDPRKMGPSDVPFQVGDFSKFQELTGWQPEISIEATLRDILDYWRDNI